MRTFLIYHEKNYYIDYSKLKGFIMFKFMGDYVEPYWKYLALLLFVVMLQVYFQINVMQETKNLIDIGISQIQKY